MYDVQCERIHVPPHLSRKKGNGAQRFGCVHKNNMAELAAALCLLGAWFQFCEYQTVAEGYGGTGMRIDRTNEDILVELLRKAQQQCRDGQSVLVNCLIGKTAFREGSISV